VKALFYTPLTVVTKESMRPGSCYSIDDLRG
jgi:hypothetical protein